MAILSQSILEHEGIDLHGDSLKLVVSNLNLNISVFSVSSQVNYE